MTERQRWTSMVRLGYAIGSGDPVDVPVRHMVVTGQTQEAGKTTALEALVERSGMKALAFVTKRGEGSFANARTIAPYFREQADWKYVASILEASRGEKLRFERAWIINASRGAHTLADVQRNVRRLMDKAKGLSHDVYMVLDAYLDDVVPLIDRFEWAKRITLEPGVNVMQLDGMPVEMQHLVIRSTIEWVLEREDNTIILVPEAWKFIPQGRGTPVKLAAESFIRQAAGLRNYLWLDSQDIAGVEKMILKSVPVWLLGVQRESNEIKRTLAQIPEGLKKPRASEIATLGVGEFIACWGTHTIRTYAQPAWLPDDVAFVVARGQARKEAAQAMAPASRRPPVTPEEEPTVKESEARELRATNKQLAERVNNLERVNEELRQQLDALVRPNADKLVRAEREVERPRARDNGDGELSEELWQAIVGRARTDAPKVLKVLATRPEIEVQVERKIVEADGSSWLGRTAQLIAEGYFDAPRKSSEVFREAQRRGQTGVAPRADEACKKLWQMGFLTREADGFRAVEGMKVNIVEAE